MHLPVKLQANLIGYWPLDEASGTTAYDYGSGGNDMAHVSAPPRIKMPNGKRALDFDGSADGCKVALAAEHKVQEVTYAVWAYFDSVAASSTLMTACPKGFANDGRGFFIFQYSTGEFAVRYGTGTGAFTNYLSAAGLLTTGQWYFLVGSKSITNSRVKGYIDTKEVVDQADSTNIEYADKVVGDGPNPAQLYLGGYRDNTVGTDPNIAFVNGKLADAMIFDKALSPEEIKAIYRATYRR